VKPNNWSCGVFNWTGAREVIFTLHLPTAIYEKKVKA
jgi:hypothetical protein